MLYILSEGSRGIRGRSPICQQWQYVPMVVVALPATNSFSQLYQHTQVDTVMHGRQAVALARSSSSSSSEWV